jgi:hypothetical protein
MKTKLFLTIIIAVFISSAPAYSQLGGLKNKVKNTVKQPATESNTPPPAETKETTPPPTPPAETQTTAQPKLQKDANGYIIDDPEVKKLLDGKTVYYSTNINMIGELLNDYGTKIAGVVVNTTADSMDLFIVGQKKYGGVSSATIHYGKIGNYYFDKKYKSYAAEQNDHSIILFNHSDFMPLHAELISLDKNATENVSEADLKKKVDPMLQEIKKLKETQKSKDKIKENETFYKSGGVSAVKSNPQLEAQFLNILNRANALPTVPENERATHKKVLLILATGL